MKQYKYEVKEMFLPSPLNGVIEANSENEAIQKLKEIYAAELGTFENEIDVKILSNNVDIKNN